MTLPGMLLRGRVRQQGRRYAARPKFDIASTAANTTAAGAHLARGGGHAFRSFHFGTSEYASCFTNLPQPDPTYFRQQAVAYLQDTFDGKLWYDRPIASLLRGERLVKGAPDATVDTHSALGRVNGRQVWSTPDEITLLQEHITTYQSPYTDLRDVIRQVEEDLFTHFAGFLIGHQCVDFGKQDGVTEIEEAVMANTVERRLNDLLLRDEGDGVLTVNRQPIYVACVSNFTNFLDLSRKTLRSLEVGIPVVLLGRSQTSQHVFRWTELLLELAATKGGMDPGMLTYLSCPVQDLTDILQTCEANTGNLYVTCSRELAAELKRIYPATVASTGGPNTLVVTSNVPVEKIKKDGTTVPNSMPADLQAAIRTSATIESAGQCTALRHCVVPLNTTDESLANLWQGTTTLTDPSQALERGQFDSVAAHQATPTPPMEDYTNPAGQADIYYKIADQLPTEPLPEYWRHVSVDFTKLNLAKSQEDVAALAHWLNTHQPISLAVNGPRSEVLKVGLDLFDQTALVVYTLGSTDTPDSMPAALTCQARPQDGECFGEVPPRSQLNDYTSFPVLVPSSNPSYDAHYTSEYLQRQTVQDFYSSATKALLGSVEDELVRGYCVTLIEYLKNVDVQNPRPGRTATSRTTVFGLQRPPVGRYIYVYATAETTWDTVAPLFLLYYVTTARDQLILTIHPENTLLQQLCETNDLPYHVATQDEWQAQCGVQPESVFLQTVVDEPDGKTLTSSFCMASLFTLRYLPAGHIKSTAAHDEEFLFRVRGLSNKWLGTVF